MLPRLARGGRGAAGAPRSRRAAWRLAVALLAALAVPGPRALAFDLEDVAKRAEAQARQAFRDPSGEVPLWLREVSYDQWRDIRFRPDLALWRDLKLPFQVQFFHPGLYYDRTVKVNVVDAKGSRPVPFRPSNFDYGRNDFGSRIPQDLGYAGLPLHYPIKKKDYLDEVIVFVGASYFRAVGSDHVYGLSARGLAVDTASPAGEEFPFFREFWLERPAPNAHSMVLYALLDSRRLTGAYRFEVHPGEADARWPSRRACSSASGWRSSASRPSPACSTTARTPPLPFEDFRPEVHDSDGLLLHSGERRVAVAPHRQPPRASS